MMYSGRGRMGPEPVGNNIPLKFLTMTVGLGTGHIEIIVDGARKCAKMAW